VAIFNKDKQTGKSIPRSNFDAGGAMPTQFNVPSQPNGSVGNTTNMGPVLGGGMGAANNMAGQAVGKMPPIPKGAIFGID
jgi:hypothetical protein